MPSLKIIKAGLMTSIQDLGRKGLGYYAIPNAGVMDSNAAKIALLLLNKNETDPLIECTSSAPHIEFNDACRIAITGTDFNWTINDQPVLNNTILTIQKGDILKGQFAKKGLRGYIAIDGDLKVDRVYDSYSTYSNARLGGYQGRLLKKDDILEWAVTEVTKFDQRPIVIRRGPEYDLLTEQSKKWLITKEYKIGADSNRMGLRLIGNPLESIHDQLENSLPVLPGFVQLPPSGLPIIVLQDGQTSGGYPRIAYVPQNYLSILNQIPLGGSFKFKLLSKE